MFDPILTEDSVQRTSTDATTKVTFHGALPA
jgi:hypothetical protein